MNKLIRLEINRIRLKNQIIALFIANVCISLLTFMMAALNAFGATDKASMGVTVVFSIDILIKAFFIVWEAILITQVIIEEFRSGTMLILYTYPVDRKKIIKAKLLTVVSVISIFMFVSHIIQNVLFFLLSKVVNFIYYKIDMVTIINLLVTTIGAIACGLISFGVGMINRSIAATIISSVVIVSTTISTQGSDQYLMATWGISGTLGIIGVIITFLTVKNIFSKDLYL